ncbi:hypothetical protein FoTM2_017648 [Fusarium oxysporum f. sp. vasinfectum]|uniref:F-box domain-containing protein n=1 Tax=Fusarium oxysporum f. sp. vasinfectum 25433 TaxID=1089449 RepID=X0KZH7_FUSOX|nr:hypothetical protein FOTG_17378 [Fusarium oxysporum f. sp. vasinfectum 25433]KAK2922795.1 hypothetical protein FoTM2_017648 [Fusarium oxysporum f. sp. vasinfectum]
MIEKSNLDGLFEISKHQQLASCIQELHIHTFHILPLEELDQATLSYIPDKERYRKRYEQQQNLITDTLNRKRLYEAISQFESCRKIVFDGSNPSWNPSYRRLSCGIPFARSRKSSSARTKFIRRILLDLLTAVATSKIQIEDLTVHVGYMDEAYCLKLSHLPYLTKPITSLRRVQLAVDPTFQKNKLQNFLSAFPELTDFELEAYRGPCCDRIAGALSGLYIPKLRKLTLITVSCTVSELENFVIGHKKTLQDIEFIYVELPDEQSWHRVFQTIRDNIAVASFTMSDCANLDMPEPTNVTELINITNSTGWDSISTNSTEWDSISTNSTEWD